MADAALETELCVLKKTTKVKIGLLSSAGYGPFGSQSVK